MTSSDLSRTEIDLIVRSFWKCIYDIELEYECVNNDKISKSKTGRNWSQVTNIAERGYTAFVTDVINPLYCVLRQSTGVIT